MIRRTRAGDLSVLQDIEVAAGAQFRDLDMDLVADDDPPSADELSSYVDLGQAWVSTDANDRPVGYLLLLVVDGAAHIEQVSVHPDHARRRIGRSLVEHAARWATQHDFSVLTLTTFTDVPWNGPYYRRLGFEEIPNADLGPDLRRIRRHEAEHGLDRWPRVAMRRQLRNESG